MTKNDYLNELEDELFGLPEAEIAERVSFYGEMIDDLIEDGLSEEDALAKIGSVSDICAQIIAELPLSALVKEKILPKRRLSVLEITLLTVGSPIWIAVSAAVFACVLALYAAILACIAALWGGWMSTCCAALGGILAGAIKLYFGSPLPGIAEIGIGIALAGIAIFLFFGCKYATKGILILSKKLMFFIKKWFFKKEAVR